MNNLGQNLLAIDASLGNGSLSYWDETGEVASRIGEPKRPLSKDLLTIIDDICRENGKTIDQIKTIAVSLGPGSYTGIRVGISTTLGIRLATGCKLVGVPTLNALSVLAESALTGVALSVGGGEFIVQSFDGGTPCSGPEIVNFDILKGMSGKIVVDRKTFNVIQGLEPREDFSSRITIAGDNVARLIGVSARNLAVSHDLVPIYAREFGLSG